MSYGKISPKRKGFGEIVIGLKEHSNSKYRGI